MDKKHLAGVAMFALLFVLTGVADAIQYSGEITNISIANPYAKVGDHINIQVDYDTVSMIASQLTVNLESWGDMYPTSIDSFCLYFLAPDSWAYSNSNTFWRLSHDIFVLESEGMGDGYIILNGHVEPISEPTTLLLVGAGLLCFVGTRGVNLENLIKIKDTV